VICVTGSINIATRATHRYLGESDGLNTVWSKMFRGVCRKNDRNSASPSARVGPALCGLSALLFASAVFSRAQTQNPGPALSAALSAQSSSQAPPNAASSQLPQSGQKITSQVKAVTLYATVRDKKGKIVSTLNKDDFTLADENAPQTISYFARESDLPLTLGPLVDTSLSQRYVIGQERDASYTFLEHMLRPDKDKAFLIHFDREVELLQDLTSSRDKLKHAVGLLQISGRDDSSSNGGGDPNDNGDNRNGGGRDRNFGGTHLYDAVFLASNEIMKKQQGRKALIVLSDGVDRGSKEILEDAIESAQRADTAVYSILFASPEEEEHAGAGHHGGMGGPRIGMGGPFPYPGGPGGGGGYPGGGGGGGQRRAPQVNREDGKKVLQRLSTETGGRFFEVSKKVSIEQIYAEIEEELRNQYSFGYTPTPADSSGRFHKIQLTMKDKDLTVVTRQGYYAQ
jgi:VWFA-related protein